MKEQPDTASSFSRIAEDNNERVFPIRPRLRCLFTHASLPGITRNPQSAVRVQNNAIWLCTEPRKDNFDNFDDGLFFTPCLGEVSEAAVAKQHDLTSLTIQVHPAVKGQWVSV